MKILRTIPYLSLLLFLSSCGGDRPENLVGQWEWKRDECLLSGEDAIFKNTDTEDRYILEFHDDENVSLEFLNQKVTLRDGNAATCNILLKGTYSYTIFGKIRFDFKEDTENEHLRTSSECGSSIKTGKVQSSGSISPKLDDSSLQSGNRSAPYLRGDSMSITQADMNTLQLIIPGFPKCKGDDNTAYFERIKPEL